MNKSQLERRNEILEARIKELESKIDKHMEVYRNNLYETVDLRTKITQIKEILDDAAP